MAKPKFDGVVEAVHYKNDGQIDWVRAYERRGSVFSDYILIPREKLIARLKAGDIFFAGRRIPQMAGTFEVSRRLQLVTMDGRERIVIGDQQVEHDYLEGVPVI